MGQRTHTGQAGFQRAERRQVRMRTLSLDQMLAEDHTARLVWAYVESSDLTERYAKIRAVEGAAGRDPIDPKILLALWLLATTDGIGSARRFGPAVRPGGSARRFGPAVRPGGSLGFARNNSPTNGSWARSR